jgi:hypothetical protein
MKHLSIMPLQFKESKRRYFADSTEAVRHNHETSASWNLLHCNSRNCDNISVEGGCSALQDLNPRSWSALKPFEAAASACGVKIKQSAS